MHKVIVLLAFLVLTSGDVFAKNNDSRGKHKQSFSLVDTGQAACYDNAGIEIPCPTEGEALYGQDAQFTRQESNHTEYFGLANAPEFKQQQYWSSNYYEVGTTYGGAPSAIGVNHGTGHIKAYPDGSDGSPMAGKYVRCVQGKEYGINKFVTRQAGTVTDKATGLMWTQEDSQVALDWQEALAFAEQ